jgi:hypothetical protein
MTRAPRTGEAILNFKCVVYHFSSPDCSGNPFFDSLGAQRKANQKKIATESGIKLLII